MEMCLNTFCFPFLLVGVVSWGVDCGVSDIPGIYASVKAAACWIDWAASCGLRRPERL
jgi:secreted trypsin-like serine protease